MSEKRDIRPLELITYYGPMHQKRILRGEHGELQDAITEVELREQDELCDRHKEILIDEVADVLVMLLQYIQYYDLPKEDIEKRVDYKLDRQKGRMKDEIQSNKLNKSK